MSSAPLKVRIGVLPEHEPLVDALQAIGIDIGSVSATKVFDGAEPDARLLCFAAPDGAEMTRLVNKLVQHLALRGVGHIGRVMLMDLPLDAELAVFIDVPAIEVPL